MGPHKSSVATVAHSATMTIQMDRCTIKAATISASTRGTQMGENTTSSTTLSVRLPVFALAMAFGMTGVSAMICAAMAPTGPSAATASASLMPSSTRSSIISE